MRMEEWDSLVQNAPRESLTFLDFHLEERPDIHEHIGNDWKRHLTDAETYDFVIDAVTHMSLHERGTSNYWDGVMYALKENGIYIGWDPSQKRRRVRLRKEDIQQYVADTYTAGLYTPERAFDIVST